MSILTLPGRCLGALAMLSLLTLPAAQADAQAAGAEVKGPLSLMVLGSGGPVATPKGRASAAYLIFTDGKPRILMDAGGGSFQRLASSGVNIKDLDVVLLSHLHIDHTADLSAIIKTVYFHNRGAKTPFPPGRTAPIRIFGPGANGVGFPPKVFPKADVAQYPATSEYVHGHYDLRSGVQRYVNIFTRAIRGGIFKYEVHDFSPAVKDPIATLLDEDGLTVKAVGVTHGPVPALAFRIEYKGHSIVYSGDTNSATDNMIKLAQGADLLVYDTAIMDDVPDRKLDAVFYALHTTPTRMGAVAAAAKAKTLVLSHITPITEPRMDQVQKLVRDQSYRGDIEIAEDLKVFNLGDDGRKDK